MDDRATPTDGLDHARHVARNSEAWAIEGVRVLRRMDVAAQVEGRRTSHVAWLVEEYARCLLGYWESTRTAIERTRFGEITRR